MNVLHNHGYGLHTHIIFGEIHQSAVWILGAIRVLGYVVAASFFVVSYADEAHAMVVCSASCLKSLLSLLLCAGRFVGQFCHSTLKGESGFGDIALPTHGMSRTQRPLYAPHHHVDGHVVEEFVAIIVGHFDGKCLVEGMVCEACKSCVLAEHVHAMGKLLWSVFGPEHINVLRHVAYALVEESLYPGRQLTQVVRRF